jgi:hypothetical protein
MAPVARHAITTDAGHQSFDSVHDVEMAAQRLAHKLPTRHPKPLKSPRFARRRRSRLMGGFGGRRKSHKYSGYDELYWMYDVFY